MVVARPFDYPASGRVVTGTIYQETGTAVLGGGRPCLVVVHGLTASRHLPEIQRLCELLASQFDVAAIDLRGHGDSPERFTWGRQEHRDLSDLVGFLRALYPAVGVLGFSIGGFIAIASAALAAGREEAGRPDALCTVGAPAHLRIWRYRFRLRGSLSHARMVLGRRHRGLRWGWPDLDWARADRLASRVAPVPLLVIHGERDWLVHPGQGRAIYEAAGPPRELLLIPRGLHAEFLIAQDPELLRAPVSEFFGRTLGGSVLPAGGPEVSFSRDRS